MNPCVNFGENSKQAITSNNKMTTNQVDMLELNQVHLQETFRISPLCDELPFDPTLKDHPEQPDFSYNINWSISPFLSTKFPPYFNVQDIREHMKHPFWNYLDYGVRPLRGFYEDGYWMKFILEMIAYHGFSEFFKSVSTYGDISKFLCDHVSGIPNLPGGGDDSFYDWLDTLPLEVPLNTFVEVCELLESDIEDKRKSSVWEEVSCGYMGRREIYFGSSIERYAIVWLNLLQRHYNLIGKDVVPIQVVPKCSFCETDYSSIVCAACDSNYCDDCSIVHCLIF
eukprot:TRINITY_DN3418_c0_g1_i2.p2 TRINITY_DN3418_c0_g1~~TRINITY_DN3418_c0_g1_i2.p2  ORF type:complete len:283 (+),score=58.44 TRINITY_DN3418_c0_g1_i2:128-976(+)